MGCDIHVHVEIKHNKKWQKFTGKHFSSGYSYTGEKSSAPFEWRSYQMFGFLANVRNDNIRPIKEPTYELPSNVSNGVLREWKHWESDGHSISFITLRELIEFDFNQNLRTPEQDFSTHSKNVLFEKISSISEDDDWELKTYYDIVGGPDGTFCKNIEELSELGDLDDVRVVFWFDN